MEKITKKHTYSIKIMRSLYLDSIFNILNFPVAKKLSNTENFIAVKKEATDPKWRHLC